MKTKVLAMAMALHVLYLSVPFQWPHLSLFSCLISPDIWLFLPFPEYTDHNAISRHLYLPFPRSWLLFPHSPICLSPLLARLCLPYQRCLLQGTSNLPYTASVFSIAIWNILYLLISFYLIIVCLLQLECKLYKSMFFILFTSLAPALRTVFSI